MHDMALCLAGDLARSMARDSRWRTSPLRDIWTSGGAEGAGGERRAAMSMSAMQARIVARQEQRGVYKRCKADKSQPQADWASFASCFGLQRGST
jgi:uncharacterized protein (DUF2235 family)